MFVHVVAVLEVAVRVMEMIDVILMLHRLATVPLGMRIAVPRMHLGLLVLLAVVQMIQMIIVRHRLAAVIRQVLVIKTLGMRTHCELLRVGVA